MTTLGPISLSKISILRMTSITVSKMVHRSIKKRNADLETTSEYNDY